MLSHVKSNIAILFEISIFLLFQISFLFKTYQLASGCSGDFFNVNFAGKQFLSGSQIEKNSQFELKFSRNGYS